MKTLRSRNISKRNSKNFLIKMLEMRELTIVIILVALVLFLSIRTDTFLTKANLLVMAQGMSVDMMIAIPMAIALIGGNIDFSAGATLGLASAVAGLAMNRGIAPLVSVLLGLLVGAILGAINAFAVNKLHVIPMVVTLGTKMAFRGIALIVFGGSTISNYPESFLSFGRANVFGIPISVVYMLIIVAIGMAALKYFNFFNQAYYIGSNKTSARLAGINIERFTYVAYIITGVVAAFAGMLLSSRLGSSSQNAGQDLDMRNVVALLVGGVSFDGGEGSIVGAVLGVTIMQVVNNALVLLYIDPSYTQVIIGTILVGSVAIGEYNKRRKAKI